MALVPTSDIYGYTTFCDDIREEAGGKVSFMGVYSGSMIVHTPFPAVIPIFAMAVSISQRRKIFSANLDLWVFLPGDSDEEASIKGTIGGNQMKIAEDTLAKASELYTDAETPIEDTYITLNANMKFLQFTLKQPGIIKVRAVIGEDMYRLGAMIVSPPPNASASRQPS